MYAVSTTREAVKDAENIKLVSELQRHKIQSYKMATVPLSVEPFAENVVRLIGSIHTSLDILHTCLGMEAPNWASELCIPSLPS